MERRKGASLKRNGGKAILLNFTVFSFIGFKTSTCRLNGGMER